MVRTTAFVVPLTLLLSSFSKVLAAVVHDGFIDEVVTSTKGMSGTFLPNPRNGNKPMMILNAKNGQINVLEDPDDSPDSIEIIDLSEGPKLCNNGERGLHTVIPSPNFTENRHLFAFFTKYKEDCLEDPDDGPHNVVMRFTMDPDTLMLDYDEGTIIFRGAPMDERLHNGGAMAFGNDGKLYITTGDAGKRKNAGTFDDVHGSIIRLNEDGTVPDDNPYTKASGYSNSYRCADTEGRVPKDAPGDSYCAEVWANGLRNPFRIDMDPNVKDKVKFSFGVVGAQHIEAIYYGGADYKGTNYGWPKYEGVCHPGDINNCEPNDDPSITMPFHWYEHISYNDGGCIGGQVHVPEGIWPPEFKYLFIDFILLKIYSLEENRTDLACDECSPPLPPTRNETFYQSIQKDGDNINEARLVEMWFGPYKDTQALYITKFGNHDTVIRIRYNGILNKPPKPAFDYKYDGVVTVEFDANRTSDPEGDVLKYEWDFGDESALMVNQTIVSHQYTQPGEYAVTLKVTDTSGQEQQVSQTVKIGTVPRVKILLPFENQTFAVGQSLRLKGEAIDFLGNPIPNERLTWEVRQHHADHFHPFLDPSNDNDFDLFAAPGPEDYLAATNSFLMVVLSAEDEYGLSETVSVDVQPNIIMVNVTTQPPGLDVVVDGYDIETPQTISSWKGFKLPVTVADQPPYVFKEWSDGRKVRTRKFSIYQKPDDPLPQVQAIFCSDLATRCENHEDCCSSYCSAGTNGTCAPMPETLSPAPTLSPTSFAPYVVVPDPPASDLEINVVTPPYTTDNGRPLLDIYPKKPDHPKIPILDEESSFSDSTSISVSLSDNNNDGNVEMEGGVDTIMTWIPYLAIGAALLVLFLFVAKCNIHKKHKKNDETVHQKSNFDDELEDDYCDVDEEACSENESDEYYHDGGDIKASGTGSTEESETQHNPISEASPLFNNNECDNSNISLSFLIPESISSELQHADDIENQAGAVTTSVVDSFLMPPLSPAHSLKNSAPRFSDVVEKERNTEVEGMLEHRFDTALSSESSLIPPPLAVGLFDDAQEDHSAEMEETSEYRIDAASTSQSSLILPQQSAALGQESFDGVLEDRSVSLSIPSPQKSVIEIIPEMNTLPGDSTLSEAEESCEDRDLEETSELIESLVLSYFSEKAVTHNVAKDDNLISLLPPLPDASDVSDEEEVDEDALVLDLLLSADIEEEFLKSFALTDPELNQQDGAAEVREADIHGGLTRAENDVSSVDHRKSTEESSILSELCIAPRSGEAECPAKEFHLSTETVIHEISDSTSAVDLSPLKSPILQPKRRSATEHSTFMSPEANYSQKQKEETPSTLSISYDDADSSRDSSASIEFIESQTSPNFRSKSTGMNLQSSFVASANENNQAQSVPVSQHQSEEEVLVSI